MKGKRKKKGLTEVNRTLTGILAASIVMSNLSGTGLVVYAEEMTVENYQKSEVEETAAEELESEEAELKESEEVSAAEESKSEDLTQETKEDEESSQESMTETESEEMNLEDDFSEDIDLEELTGEDALFASVYLQFQANGGSCDISMMELTPDNMELMLPQAQKAGYRFTGWYMDEACTIAFDENNIFWEAGSTYVLYAGYEQLEMEATSLIERTLQQNVNGVVITVEGNMPAEATLAVRAEQLTQNEQEKLIQESDIVASIDELDTEQNTSYSYDITICYQDVEYEPYLFDEMMEVTFSFEDAQALKDASQMEVFHIDDNENVEKIEIKETSENEVSFDADTFSTYILITKVEYAGDKNWTYEFTGDVQTFTAPVAGQYTFACYGAGTNNSKGSFAQGTIGLEKDETIFIYVGGKNNTFNGGGNGGSVWHSASNTEGSFSQYVTSDNGCGATDVRVGTEIEGRLIVAGGGGGNGHCGGVNYSYNGSTTSGGPFYTSVSAKNAISSNNVLGQGSGYSTEVKSGDWGSGSYPEHGTYSNRTVTGGGGGGYYGGKSGYAGTSKVISGVEYQGKEYQVMDSVIENLVYTGDGMCQIALYSIEGDTITYYNHNMSKLGEIAGLTGSYVDFPEMTEKPERASDSMYDYTYLGWDDMATEEIEHYTDEETVAAALNGNRNYIAVYEERGKSYTITLDSADAQNAGTTDVVAIYHSTLPDIVIPSKEGFIFVGYYTGPNGAGEQIYSAQGKGIALSEFVQDSVIYAHWVQPIASVTNPENKEVLAGYAGVILTTEVELSEKTGYVLSYQWYLNQENSNTDGTVIEAADSRKLVIPQGFQPGQYYFYCVITAVNAINGQSVSVCTTPAMLSVEKGVMGMEQVEIENENVIYDGIPKALKAAINNSNPYTIYYATEPLDSENYMTKGSTKPNEYLDAGTYTNYIYVTGSDFADFSGSISMIIQKAEPYVYLSGKNTSYNGLNQTINPARVYGVDEKELSIAAAYVYFMDEACTRKTDADCGALEEGGAPLAVGTYYVHAVTEETTNYKAAATKVPVMFNILGTDMKYSISGYHGIYDGKPHGLQIMNEDEANVTLYFSDKVALTKDNYQSIGTKEVYEYTEAGNYVVYYIAVSKLAGGIDQYRSGMAEIVIEQAKATEDSTESGKDEKEEGDSTNQDSGNENGGDSGNSQGGSSSNTGDTEQEKTEKPHVHNYELLTFDAPTVSQEGKAIYRCKECGHELVITYPMLEEGEKEQTSVITPETDEDEEEKEEEKQEKKKTQAKQNENLKKQVSSEEIQKEEPKEEESRTLTEAELYKIAQALGGLTEAQIRELYEKGLLNMTQEELQRLLSILRTQIIINEEEVSLSPNTPLTDEDTEHEEPVKASGAMWSLLWAFLLGAAVMYLICKIKETKNTKKPKMVQNQTRKLN